MHTSAIACTLISAISQNWNADGCAIDPNVSGCACRASAQLYFLSATKTDAIK